MYVALVHVMCHMYMQRKINNSLLANGASPRYILVLKEHWISSLHNATGRLVAKTCVPIKKTNTMMDVQPTTYHSSDEGTCKTLFSIIIILRSRGARVFV